MEKQPTRSDVLNKLKGVKSRGGSLRQFTARCPIHGGTQNNVRVSTIDGGRVVISCRLGCGHEELCGALGIVNSSVRQGGTSAAA